MPSHTKDEESKSESEEEEKSEDSDEDQGYGMIGQEYQALDDDGDQEAESAGNEIECEAQDEMGEWQEMQEGQQQVVEKDEEFKGTNDIFHMSF